MANPYWVYIVRGRSGALYTGCSVDVARRVWEHNESDKGSKWARKERPVRLVWFQVAGSRSTALKIEKKIKTMKKAQKEALVASNPVTP